MKTGNTALFLVHPLYPSTEPGAERNIFQIMEDRAASHHYSGGNPYNLLDRLGLTEEDLKDSDALRLLRHNVPLELTRNGRLHGISPVHQQAGDMEPIDLICYGVPFTPDELLPEGTDPEWNQFMLDCAWRILVEAKDRYAIRRYGLGALTAPWLTLRNRDFIKKVEMELELWAVDGNAASAYTCVLALEQASEWIEGDSLAQSRVAIMGATGSVGEKVARMLNGRVKELLYHARNQNRVARLIEKVPGRSVSLEDAYRQADFVITMTSESKPRELPPDLPKKGQVILDFGKPANIDAAALRHSRPDDLVYINGANLTVPQGVSQGMFLNLPDGQVFPCAAELSAVQELDLPGHQIGDRTLDETLRIAAEIERMGYSLAPFIDENHKMISSDRFALCSLARE